MQAYPDMRRLLRENAREQRPGQQVARPLQDRCDVSEFKKCEIGREAYPAYDHKAVGIGSIVVAGLWLAFYVAAVLHSVAFAH